MSSAAPDAERKLPSLKRNIAYAMTARIFLALTQFVILIIVVRLGTQEDVGALTLASAFVTPLFFLTSMGMNEVHIVDDLKRFSRADYVALRLAGGGVAILLTVLIVLIFQDDETRVVQLAAIAFSFVRFFGAQSSLNQGVFQRAERLNYVAVSTIARGLIGLAVFTVTFWYTRSLPVAFLCEAVGWFFSYFLIDRTLLIRMDAETQLGQLRHIRIRTVLALAWWVLPVGIALWMIRAAASIPPMVLVKYTDLAAVGLFGTLTYVHSALSMAVGPMATASAARLRRYYREGRLKDFVSLTSNLMLMAGAIGIAAIAFSWFAGDYVLWRVFGESYRNAELLTLVITGTAVSIVAMQVMIAITAAQAFNHRLLSSGLSLVAALIASFLLIPQYGIYGAGWAMLATAAVRLVFVLVGLRIVLRVMPGVEDTDPGRNR